MDTYTYTIVVMDYESCSLRFFYFDHEPEDPEAWLEKHDSAWNESQCYWMGTNSYGINEDHIYGADSMEEVIKCQK